MEENPMLTIPALPTDNLYKFASLAGVVMIVAGSVGPLMYAHQQSVWLVEKQEVLFGRSHEMRAKGGQPESDQQYLKELEQNFALHQRLRMDAIRRAYWIGIAVILGGIVCVWYGFPRWQYRIQRIHDRILEIDLIRAERSITTGNNSSIRTD